MTPASQIAHYKITSKLGEGGMGAVYRATDTKLHRDVALKVLPEAFAADTARLARFEREAQMLAALNHPNIAAVYGIEQGAIVMELVEGENLKGPIPVETAIQYARQMVIALEAAHVKGIIHRDLKPANIKVTQNGTVKLLDFGLAKVSEEAVSSAGTSPTVSPTLTLAMTQDGAILGTAAYMSPEQARGKAVDKRADIWAFGVVLFEMLSGAPLFGGGETVTDTIASVMKEEPDWKALPEETPAHIRRLLKFCLRKDPKKRLQAIGDVRLLLDEPDEVLAVQAAASPASGRPGHWLPWAITGVVVVATAVAAGTMWLRPKPVNVGKARFALAIPEGNTDSRYRAATQAVPSPDGRNIAFVAEDKAGKSNLWVRPLESVVPHKLDKTEDANYPFWSPDGQFIAFFAEGKLKRIALSGGSPQTLCEVAVSGPVIDFLPGDGGAWSRKGVIVFATGGSALMRVRASGEGVATPASTLNSSESAHSWPQFLPDGQHMLYLARATDGQSAIYIQELGSSQRTLVMKNAFRAVWSPPGYLLFVRESTLFAQRMNAKTYQLEGEAIPIAEEVTANDVNGRAAFAVSENGVLIYRGGPLGRIRQLAWYDRQGNRLRAVGRSGNYAAVKLSPDEKSAALMAASAVGRSDTWIMDLSSGVLTPMTLDFQSSTLMGPWSRDSQRIAVNRRTGGPAEVTVVSGRMRILATEMRTAHDWSPDGASLLGTGQDDHRLYAVSLTGETGTRTILDTPYRKRDFRFSPDGQWVAYSSDESGRFEVFVAAFPSFAKKRQVSNNGGSVPFWRKDGKEILYLSSDGTMMSVGIQLGSAIEVGAPKPLFQLQRGRFFDFSIAPTGDGERFLVIEGEQAGPQAPTMVVLNWAAELKQ